MNRHRFGLYFKDDPDNSGDNEAPDHSDHSESSDADSPDTSG